MPILHWLSDGYIFVIEIKGARLLGKEKHRRIMGSEKRRQSPLPHGSQT
jgi:hypothetical protein